MASLLWSVRAQAVTRLVRATVWSFQQTESATCSCKCPAASADRSRASEPCLTASASATSSQLFRLLRNSPWWHACRCPCPTSCRQRRPSAYPTSRHSCCRLCALWRCWKANRKDDACTPNRLQPCLRDPDACDDGYRRSSAMQWLPGSRDRCRMTACGLSRLGMMTSLCD